MARIYREMPLNSIWEGAGNIMALDLLRALRGADVAAAIDAELAPARGGHAAFDRLAATLPGRLDGGTDEAAARTLARDVALLVQASLLRRHATDAVFAAFCTSRLQLGADVFGLLPADTPFDTIVDRSHWELHENLQGPHGRHHRRRLGLRPRGGAHRRARGHERRPGRCAGRCAGAGGGRNAHARRAGAAVPARRVQGGRGRSAGQSHGRSLRRAARRLQQRRRRFRRPDLGTQRAGLGVGDGRQRHGRRAWRARLHAADARGRGARCRVRGPHRQHRVDGRPAEPAEHGRLQRQQACRGQPDRNAVPGSVARHRPDQRVGAVPVLRADRHPPEPPQPARCTECRRRRSRRRASASRRR